MDEYEFLTKILDKHYLAPDSEHLNEDGVQTAEIITRSTQKGKEGYTLYRYSLEKGDFFPFFNTTHKAPEELRSFCDYILLAPYKGILYVMLIELKKDKGNVTVQLEASRQFFVYIIKTAERIKAANNVSFDSNNIKTLKIKLKGISVKRMTKRREDLEYVKDEDFYVYKTKHFDIRYVCNFYKRQMMA